MNFESDDEAYNFLKEKGWSVDEFILRPNKPPEQITEEEFDSVFDDWVDNIETERGFEQMNQDDFNY